MIRNAGPQTLGRRIDQAGKQTLSHTVTDAEPNRFLQWNGDVSPGRYTAPPTPLDFLASVLLSFVTLTHSNSTHLVYQGRQEAGDRYGRLMREV